ncbi:MAG: MHS family MFS transporter [Planctomycetaceae bacterium]|nr:MHS family MFS transporter [Planctomycetaceae bacterium]
MTDSNPYKSPLTADGVAEIDLGHVTTLGVWRDGNLLVMAKNADLPQRCLKTNGPASPIPIKHRLSWHHPLIYLPLLMGILPGLVLYVFLVIVFVKKATVEIWLSDQWKAVRRRRMFIAGLFATVGIIICLVGGLLMISTSPWWTFGLILGVLVLFGSAIYGLQSASVISPKRITNSHVWLKGVHPDYLDDLPSATEMQQN